MLTSNFVGSKKRFACHDATESDPCNFGELTCLLYGYTNRFKREIAEIDIEA